MFNEESFDVFEIDGLENRMKAIRENIQPAFQAVGEKSKNMLQDQLKEVFYLHIAQHRRRTVYPPESTWCALSTSKRGYKRYPHFQIAINDEYLAAWLSFIDNPDYEQEMAEKLLHTRELFEQLSADFVINQDHTQKTIQPFNQENLEKTLIRWQKVKKGEFQIGRVIHKDSELLAHPESVSDFLVATHLQLIPVYQVAQQIQLENKVK